MALQRTVQDGLSRTPSGKRWKHFAKTAAYTILRTDTGSTYTNLGATAGVTFTLPTGPKKGDNFTFVCQAEHPLTITPGSTGAIYTNEAKQADDKDVTGHRIGDVITIEADGDSSKDWVVKGKFGPWGHDQRSIRWVYSDNFNKRPLLNASILITATAPTLAQMALLFAANRDWETIGNSATAALTTHSTRGGITLTTAGAADDTAAIRPHTDTDASGLNQADFSTDDEIYFRCVMHMGATITADMIVMGGFLLSLDNITDYGIGNDAEQAAFRYEDGVASGVWQCTSSDNNTDDTNSSGITVVLSTRYDLEIRVTTGRVPYFFINGDLVSTNDALGTGHDLIPYMGVAEPTGGGGAARAIDISYMEVSKTLNS